jgi:hypothetical protein
MKLNQKLGLGIVALTAASAHAQYAPPPPPTPFQGFINEQLRNNDPYMNQWDFGGVDRLRLEGKHGFAVAGQGGSLDFRDHGGLVNNDYVLNKLLFHVGYTEKWWNVYLEGRSSSSLNDRRYAFVNGAGTVKYQGVGPESDTLDLQQAYVMFGNHKEFPVSVKAGRQELSYGDERLIGAFGWNNIGRVFDAVKVRWQNSLFGVDFFASHPVIPEDNRFNNYNPYDSFSGAYLNTALVPKNILELYMLARNSSPQALASEPVPQFGQPSQRDIYTAGGRMKSKPGEYGDWDYTMEGAYQFGDFKDPRAGAPAGRQRQDAFMFVGNVGYTFSQAWSTPRIALEYSFASGDNNPTNKVHNTFENLFPTNHKFYGYMDLLSLQNLHDVRGIYQFKPTLRSSISLEGHGFWLADTHDSFYAVTGAARGGAATTAGTAYGVNPSYSSFLGEEFDVIAGYALTRYAQLEGGYGHFFIGDYIKQSLSSTKFGSRDADWVYLQTTIKF